MNPHDDTPNEEQIAALLKASETDAAAPDADALARLRVQSTAAFVATETAALERAGRHALRFRRVRWLGAAAAILLLGCGLGLYSWLARDRSGPPFGRVIDNFAKADTLHLRLTLGNKESEIWLVNKPHRMRWDDLDGNYRIADGAKFWIVNENANEARPADAVVQPNPLVMLGLRGLIPSLNFKDALPVERIRDGNEYLLLYRVEAEGPTGKFWVEALVNARTQRLHSIRTQLGELTIIAYDQPVDSQKFAIADTLTEDGRIGTVTDVQGIVTIKPVLHERWTAVRQQMVLRPGDWVRTDARGANATALRLVKNSAVILGPKTLVELIGPKKVRLIEGEIEVTPTPGSAIELLGPGSQKIAINGKQLYRVAKQQLVRMERDPPWLLGFKGATTNEALGSLIALVDGRNVPLSVGYHKVSVDIRDQIARTVIEESFVNHTGAVLEGVFYFPLPQDASISGFGMWIGDNLVEADVVEKQRAREIYETILRERRDPGLLEWSGGNIFKARVFPIPAHAEKRIKITYTQVLPLKGNRYCYSYGLQSELLQQHPLRELAIDVKVNSVIPLKSVTSPTHPTRDELSSPRPTGGEGAGVRGSHSAHVEFTAQGYTPTRDFEVVVETEGRQADVVMIPHRRGDDGYFMLQLTPPGGSGNWDRPILPNGEPLKLLILADTSASIDASQRATQATFIGSLLASLTPKDTFNLATCDVNCDWAFTQATKADAETVSKARDFLAKRSSLGWTDLDVAFASVLKQCDANSHVIYVGDGIITAGDADPIAFTKRLRRLLPPSPPGRGVGGEGGPTLHAVSLGSSYEPAVLKAIASIGNGSMRKITSEQGPAAVARELLGEIAQPALRDIKVEFKGFKVARVYPDTLANIPAGSQQILLGRYLPDGRDPTGEVIVTGTQAGKPVRFSTRASFKDAEQGNSFIPRLWARMHLDGLLEQGSSDAIKDEIIALSEEFQIITRYTSLLVLETDADRERFKVKRRFQMRDGERFFADGHDNAVFDLAQKQMKLAGAWRTALRRSVLSELARLGREPRLFHGSAGPAVFDSSIDYARLGMLGDGRVNLADGDHAPHGQEVRAIRVEVPGFGRGVDEINVEWDERPFGLDGDKNSNWRADLIDERLVRGEMSEPSPFFLALDSVERLQNARGHAFGGMFIPNDEVLDFKSVGDGFGGRGTTWQAITRPSDAFGRWFNALFPPLREAPGQPRKAKSNWPAATRALAKSLLRTEQLAKLPGGLEIIRQTDVFNPRWGDLTGHSRRLDLVAAKAWLTRAESDGGETLVSWCDGKEVGVFSKAFQLGRVRAATPLDVQPAPPKVIDHPLASLESAYPFDYVPTLTPQGKDRTMLVLKYQGESVYETRILIDTGRHVILSIEDRVKGKIITNTQFDDFIEASAAWWPRRIETTNHAGKRVALITQTVKTLTLKELDQQTKTELAGRAEVQMLHMPAPTLRTAKKALAAGKAGFDDHFVLLIHFLHSQQWTRVFDHLRQAETLAPGKPGLRWLRSGLLEDSRRHDELRQRYQAEAKRLATESSADAYALAQYFVGQSNGVLQANEMLALLDTLKPLYDKQPPHVQGRQSWLQLRAHNLSQAGQDGDALRLQHQLATDYPRDYALQQTYAQSLAGAGDYPAAYAWLTRVVVKDATWLDEEEESLRATYTSLLEQQARHADLVNYLAAWVEQNPTGRAAYERYLSALVKSDQIEKADALALRWLKEAQVPGELAPAAESRLHSAVSFMLGDGYQIRMNRIPERWLPTLGQAALFFLKHEARASIAEQILSSDRFLRSEEGRGVRKALAGILSAEVDKLSADQVQRIVGWLVQSDDLAPAAWGKIAARLQRRWTSETRDHVKHELGQVIADILWRQDMPKELLAFLRLQRLTGPERRRAEYANQLFDRLAVQPWSAQFEAELFSLLERLSSAEDAGVRLFASLAALLPLTDALVESRTQSQSKLLEHPEKLTRTELLKKQAEIRRLACEGVADRLRQEAAMQSKALAPWLIAESVYLDVRLDRNLKQAAADAWKYLGAAPGKVGPAGTTEQTLEEHLRQRYLVTLTNLAARKGADAALVERLLNYFDDGIKAETDAERWKLAKYRLLIARDRVPELEQSLRHWAGQDDADSRWRIALGHLLAEQGKLPEAIQQFEAVETADELSPAAYRTLAGWYLVQKQREAYERAALAVYQTMPEHHLRQMLAIKLQPWQQNQGSLPTELDPELLRIFAVLFDKSAAPERYLSHLQQFYQASHDFRLLTGLPDTVVGHTAARVYPFVQRMQSVLEEVRDEATADEIVKRIHSVRPRAKTAVDQRALDLLELLVERRATEVQNQPGPHRDKALAALQRAFKRDWSPGEPRLMADFLGSLVAPFGETPRPGQIFESAFTGEQLRQLKALDAMAAPGSIDRLHIAYRHALTLRSYQRTADAIDVMQAALDEFQAAHGGVLPIEGNDALRLLIGLLERAGQFARGEKVLLGQLAHPVHAQQRRRLIVQLDELYRNALGSDGDVSLGKGATLYNALTAKMRKDLEDPDQHQRSELLDHLQQVYHVAKSKNVPGAVADLKTFAFEIAPLILKEQTYNREYLVGRIANSLYDLAGPRDGIAFLLNEIESEPRWLRFNNQDGWSRRGSTLAHWRTDAKDLGDVEGRLLKLVLAELRRDLETREERSRTIYHRGHERFWKEKAADFVKTAEAVLAERRQSGPSVQYIADYLYWGLGKANRAIEILFDARKQKLLDETGEAMLVNFLQREDRYAESIAVLQPLMERRPTNLDYRALLMRAYFRTARKKDLLALLKETDAFFHQKDRWSENTLNRLAHITLQNELFEQSVAYFKELIPLHERSQPDRGIGNGKLSGYYVGLANAYTGLKKTPEAVEAAGGAIVAWGSQRDNRAKALDTLKQVLLRSPDLNAFVIQFDKEKQDSAIVRKALGLAYRDKKDHAKAIKQLELAVELQPNDAEIYPLLIACYDDLGDKDAAVRTLLQAVQHSRRDLRLYQDLGNRYAAAGHAIEAERAFTSIVEMLPGESESHALLAEVREKQNRWADAIHHWEQVAQLRALEPTGLLKLAAAQIHEKRWDLARESLRKLDARTWPSRFGDVRGQVRTLAERMSPERKK